MCRDCMSRGTLPEMFSSRLSPQPKERRLRLRSTRRCINANLCERLWVPLWSVSVAGMGSSGAGGSSDGDPRPTDLKPCRRDQCCMSPNLRCKERRFAWSVIGAEHKSEIDGGQGPDAIDMMNLFRHRDAAPTDHGGNSGRRTPRPGGCGACGRKTTSSRWLLRRRP